MAVVERFSHERWLPVERLRRRCDPAGFASESTAELEPLPGIFGQQRATEALSFGLAMDERNFNTYVAGADGTGRTTAVRSFLHQAAAALPTPPDWCYIHNFNDPSQPRALQLQAGRGRSLRDDVRAASASTPWIEGKTRCRSSPEKSQEPGRPTARFRPGRCTLASTHGWRRWPAPGAPSLS
ncbi:MAG TPA: Lon-like protease helical domain-containing protein [Dehalococcoidia bacterium]|jgi:hypothetical protein|nr:Lon-like protease helical domain-containing protein [Dehalococcoidia bacterium]